MREWGADDANLFRSISTPCTERHVQTNDAVREDPEAHPRFENAKSALGKTCIWSRNIVQRKKDAVAAARQVRRSVGGRIFTGYARRTSMIDATGHFQEEVVGGSDEAERNPDPAG